ncbi:MAG TPA: SDR family oxidoreductase [Terriglobales bacterium]
MPTFAKDCLKGKAILITGGLGAIGRVAVSRLLEHSAKVAVNDLLDPGPAPGVVEQLGWPRGRCTYLQADVTSAHAATAVVAGTLEAFGRIDAALCHAGIVYSGPILDCQPQDWDKMMSVNVRSALLVAQAAARSMIERAVPGRIIFTSSWVQDVPWPGITPYTVTKSAIKMLMRGMSRELAGHGVRVNAVAPGIVAAGMAKRQWDTEPDYRRRAEKAIPLGYLQPAESVADALVFLCSDASDYMTGATLLVDGGCSLYPMD